MALGPQRPGWEHLAEKGRRVSLASLSFTQASDQDVHLTCTYLSCPYACKTNSYLRQIN